MVRRGRGAGPRPGLSLVEVMAAVVVFGVGLLGVAACISHAARLSESAARREAALGLAAEMLDSIALAPDPVPGQREEGMYSLRWSVEQRTESEGAAEAGTVVEGAVVTLVVEYSDGFAERALEFEMVHFHGPVPGGEP